MATSRLDCPSCFDYSGNAIAELLRHIRLFHADTTPFNVRCNLGCARDKPFSSFFTFRDHIYRFHSGIKARVCGRQLQPVDLQPPDHHYDLSPYESSDDELDSEPPDKREQVDYSAQLQRSAAIFLLKVQEKHHPPINNGKHHQGNQFTLSGTYVVHYSGTYYHNTG